MVQPILRPRAVTHIQKVKGPHHGCLASPQDGTELLKGKNLTQKELKQTNNVELPSWLNKMQKYNKTQGKYVKLN